MPSRTATAQVAPEEQDDAEIGFRVHTLMWERRITQAQLGERIGLSQTGLGRRLRGKAGWSVSDLRAVARELQVTIAYLFGEESDLTPEPNGPLSD